MKTKLLGSLAIVLGVFLFAGVAVASTTDVLQPAGATTSLESLRVGVAGQGGVTFFNGTVLNEGTDPFTVGDDMRIDGEIWRVEKGGANPIKISDHVIPTATNTNNFGTSANRWKNVYTKDISFSGDIIPTTQPGWTRSDSSIGSETKQIKKVWTDQANIRQNSVQQLFLYDGTGAIHTTIAGAGDDYSTSISGTKGNILLRAQNGSDVGSVELFSKTTLKFAKRTDLPYSCTAAHEGEIFYYAAGASHDFLGCRWTQAGNYFWEAL